MSGAALNTAAAPTLFPCLRRCARHLLLGLALIATASPAIAQLAPREDSPELLQQRQWYLAAQAALAGGDRSEFERLRAQLNDYPLQPYLDYAALISDLNAATPAAIAAFRNRHADTVLEQQLAQQWLNALVDAGHWSAAIAAWQPGISTTETTCRVLKARYDSGDPSALDAVPALWNVTRSQPNGCDPLFEAWIAAGGLTPTLTWERFDKVLRAGHTRLARYISTLMPARKQALAQQWLQIRQQPTLLRDTNLLPATAPERAAILQYGLERLALQDAPLALQLWYSYDAQVALAPAQSLTTLRYIALRLLTQGAISDAETLLQERPALRSDTLLEWLLRDALQQQDWHRFDNWLALLPESARTSERWRYWQARSLMQRGNRADTQHALVLYAALARTRSFYGFLSADLLGVQYALVDQPVLVDTQTLAALSARPPLARAYELFRLGEHEAAQREWRDGIADLDREDLLNAGRLAQHWGWHRNGIQAMIRAEYWNDLQVRFPLAYAGLVDNAADTSALQPPFVFAVVRQESAFIAEARSSAGAMGLMQLLPSTARETARRSGLSLPSTQDLLQPAVNIPLGSRYLSGLMQQFDGNRILAAAAYNAGPNRVRQWLQQSPAPGLPFDIWIETVPYGETRGYVQNVLAYNVIYGYRLGTVAPFITDAEANQLL